MSRTLDIVIIVAYFASLAYVIAGNTGCDTAVGTGRIVRVTAPSRADDGSSADLGESPRIVMVCGTGIQGYNGDNIPAEGALLNAPWNIVCDPHGTILVADKGAYRIRKIEGGKITTLAGTGVEGHDTGVLAISARLGMLSGLSRDGTGNIIVTTFTRILKISADGILTTVAGNGVPGFAGDGGPALNASFLHASGTIIGPDGRLYLCDVANHRIRVVDKSGIISTLAGTGTNGFFGDGGPAVLSQLFYPGNLVFNPEGELLVADYGNDRIRKIDRKGIITTVVGGGVGARGWRGDGGPATAARLFCPMAMAFDKKGNLYFLDKGNDCIRKVATNGIITTVAGRPTDAYKSNDLRSYFAAHPEAVIKPYGLTVDHEGNLLFTQFDIPMIRKVILVP